MKTPLTLCAALLTAVLTPLAAQTPTQLSPQQDRISDEAISADQQAYESLQGRIKGLNDRGRPLRDYFLAKAQCWLDVSFHEYTRNDRSAFPQAALSEAEKLIVDMERGSEVLSVDTPLVNDAARLRPDLWERSAAMKRQPGFRCAQRQIACAEVELVHAGNEFNQQQWRHAKPYVQIAEDQIAQAQTLIEQCEPPAPPPPVAPVAVVPAPPPPPVPVAPPPSRIVELLANLVFNFDRSDANDIRPFSMVQLDDLLARVKRDGLQITGIRLIGHADRLNGTGHGDYNQRLSERRVATVREVLARKGVDGSLIGTEARGDSQQVNGCQGSFKSKRELEECLLPNRRVELWIDARMR